MNIYQVTVDTGLSYNIQANTIKEALNISVNVIPENVVVTCIKYLLTITDTSEV